MLKLTYVALVHVTLIPIAVIIDCHAVCIHTITFGFVNILYNC